MKITGFSFIKNALKYDYPIIEAIKSILPICDDFVIAVGKSEDNTLELIKSIDNEKIKIIETVWNDSLRQGGQVLAVETNKAFNAINNCTDWAFYIQGDEVVHEKYLDEIYNNMLKFKDEPNIDGLLLNYLHFYGSYNYVGNSSKWYPKEIRVIKNDKSIYSYRDAQGFRKGNNLKLNVKPINAYMYHYGWVKNPRSMQAKQEDFNKYWHNDEWISENIIKSEEFDYSSIDTLNQFTGTHPSVMKERIERLNWNFDFDISIDKRRKKDKIKNFLNNYFGIDFSYKNYNII